MHCLDIPMSTLIQVAIINNNNIMLVYKQMWELKYYEKKKCSDFLKILYRVARTMNITASTSSN